MAATLFAILVAFAFGFAVIMLLWPQRLRRADLPVLAFLTAGIGVGLSSCLFFLWIAVLNGQRERFVRNEVVVVIALSLCALFARRRKRVGAMVRGKLSRSGGPGWIITAAFSIALLSAGIAFARLSIAAPHGSFDAWGIWNLHAKFLLVNDQHWRDGFSHDLVWSHPDYPLLVPASVARLWSYSGAESASGPISIAGIFTLATVGLLVSALSALRSAGQGLLAGTILLATPFFVVLGAAQYADVPLGFFCLATLVLICLREQPGFEDNALFTLAGITAGLAAWTKNEGSLFFVSLLLAHLILNLRTKNWSQYFREVGCFAAGALPILAVLIYFKLVIGSNNDLFSQPGTLLHRLADLSRYRTILRAGLAEFFNFGAWLVSLPACIAFYLLLTGFRGQQSKTAVACLTLVFTAVGYFVIYLIAPLPLDWLLASSLNRLFIQLWPSVLFLVFLQARTPEEAASASVSQSQIDQH